MAWGKFNNLTMALVQLSVPGRAWLRCKPCGRGSCGGLQSQNGGQLQCGSQQGHAQLAAQLHALQAHAFLSQELPVGRTGWGRAGLSARHGAARGPAAQQGRGGAPPQPKSSCIRSRPGPFNRCHQAAKGQPLPGVPTPVNPLAPHTCAARAPAGTQCSRAAASPGPAAAAAGRRSTAGALQPLS